MSATHERPATSLRGLQPRLPARGDLVSLRAWNVAAMVFHAISGGALLWLGNDLTFPINASVLTGPPGSETLPATETLFQVSVTWLTASFALVSAFAHLVVATVGWERYVRDLERGYNQFRWVEYALSSSLMIVLIAQLTGIYDVAALLGIAGANIAMILFGWAMDRHNADRRIGPERPPAWWSFIFGCIPGVVPWIAIVTYIVLAGSAVPNFVYAIFVSLFLFFNVFAVVMVLEYARVGPWARVAFTERTYVVLSLTAKVALTWQVGANVLIDM